MPQTARKTSEPNVMIRVQPAPVTEREKLCRKLARYADIVHMNHLQLLVDAAEVWSKRPADSAARLRLVEPDEREMS
jgi:hypothetical protein